jgi:hypothetical protein
MVRGFSLSAASRKGAIPGLRLVVEEQCKQDDDWYRNAQKPKKNASTHCRLLLISRTHQCSFGELVPPHHKRNPPAPAPGGLRTCELAVSADGQLATLATMVLTALPALSGLLALPAGLLLPAALLPP